MITVTDIAARKIKQIALDENLQDHGLRLRVLGGGCAGFSYDLYFEDSPSPLDEEFLDKGIRFYVDQLSLQYLSGTELDYTEDLYKSGFKFVNPNVTSTCGCGSSFSA